MMGSSRYSQENFRVTGGTSFFDWIMRTSAWSDEEPDEGNIIPSGQEEAARDCFFDSNGALRPSFLPLLAYLFYSRVENASDILENARVPVSSELGEGYLDHFCSCFRTGGASDLGINTFSSYVSNLGCVIDRIFYDAPFFQNLKTVQDYSRQSEESIMFTLVLIWLHATCNAVGVVSRTQKKTLESYLSERMFERDWLDSPAFSYSSSDRLMAYNLNNSYMKNVLTNELLSRSLLKNRRVYAHMRSCPAITLDHVYVLLRNPVVAGVLWHSLCGRKAGDILLAFSYDFGSSVASRFASMLGLMVDTGFFPREFVDLSDSDLL